MRPMVCSGNRDDVRLTNIRAGGKYVRVYFDDLEYTARRAADFKPVKHEQKTVTVPYPANGRKY